MLCRLYHWQMELQLEKGQQTWSPRVQKHLNRCNRCRQHAAQLGVMFQTLTLHPPVIASEKLYSALCGNTLEYVERGLISDQFKDSRFVYFRAVKRFAAAAAASLLLTAGLLIFNAEHPEEITPINLKTPLYESPLPKVAEWSLQPMQAEIEKLMTSAQDAVVFLWNCLPGYYEYPKEQPESNTMVNQEP